MEVTIKSSISVDQTCLDCLVASHEGGTLLVGEFVDVQLNVLHRACDDEAERDQQPKDAEDGVHVSPQRSGH